MKKKVTQIINNAGGHFRNRRKIFAGYKSIRQRAGDNILLMVLVPVPAQVTLSCNRYNGVRENDRMLQQMDNQKRGHARGLVVYNNAAVMQLYPVRNLEGFG